MSLAGGRRVTVTVRDPRRRGRVKPPRISGAGVYTYAGEFAPSDPSAYKFEGLITRTKFTLDFDQLAVAGTVWVTANWYTETGRTGPACAPVSINFPAAQALPKEKKLKLAA